MDNNIDFLQKLIHEYHKDRLPDKYTLILKTLKNSEVYVHTIEGPLITVETGRKHHYPILFSVKQEDIKDHYYEKITIKELLEIIDNNNKYSDYKIHDLIIEPKSKDSLIVDLKELKNI